MSPALAAEVEFEGRISAPAPRFLSVDEDGSIYLSLKDGGVAVMTRDGKLLRTIGGKGGPGDGVLREPMGIALYGGKVYVAEGFGRVVIFSRDGEFLDGFGGWGTGEKEFMDTTGISVHDGVIYVADMGNQRVQVFGPNGVYMGSIGARGEGREKLIAPTDVAVDYQGHVLVVDGNDEKVKIYTPAGEFKGMFEYGRKPYAVFVADAGIFVTDIEQGGFHLYAHGRRSPELFFFLEYEKLERFRSIGGIAVDGEGRVYVADPSGGRVGLYRLNLKMPEAGGKAPPPTSVRWVEDINVKARKLMWDEKGGALYASGGGPVLVIKGGEVAQKIEVFGWDPVSMALDPGGFLWVLDRAGNRLLKFGDEGEVLLSTGLLGSVGGLFSGPSGLFLSGEGFIAPGSESEGLLSTGSLSGMEWLFSDLSDVVISNKGFIYVADRGNGRVLRLSQEGKFLNVVGMGGTSALIESPVALAVDEEGILYVLDDSKKTVTVYSTMGLPLKEFGGEGEGRGKFGKPVDLAITENEIFVLDAGLNRVQAFSRKGRYLREFGTRGGGKGDFRDPASIVAMDSTRLLVADHGNGRVQVLDLVYTPSAPGGLAARDGEEGVSLSWNRSPESYVEGYRVYRSSEPDAGFERIASVKATTYFDGGATKSGGLYYRVSAVARGGNESRLSGTAEARPAG